MTETDDEVRRLNQCRYAAFPQELKAAMKIAADRWNWNKATWMLQTELISEALESGRYDAETLAEAYASPPPRTNEDDHAGD